MEATITVEELRKVAKSLGIKNVKNYKKVELLKLVEEEQKRSKIRIKVQKEKRKNERREIFLFIQEERPQKRSMKRS